MVLKLPTWKPIELCTATMALPSYGSVSDRTSRPRWPVTDPASMDARACALSSAPLGLGRPPREALPARRSRAAGAAGPSGAATALRSPLGLSPAPVSALRRRCRD